VLDDFELVCVSESELMQWQARGQIHLASCRLLSAGSDKASLFALAPFLKLDDAKARVVVRLLPNVSRDQLVHPSFCGQNVLTLSWEAVQSLCPVLPQFRRRLESFLVPVEDWDISTLWDDWIVTQGCYERALALQVVLGRIGFVSQSFLADLGRLFSLVNAVIRPSSIQSGSSVVPPGWLSLLMNRDEILKRLRFEGHSDRVSFLHASVLEISRINHQQNDESNFDALPADRDSGWELKDITESVLDAINRTGGETPLSMSRQISPILGAAYLRLYDELFYGQKSWPICFNLLRFMKYSISCQESDWLTVALFAAYPPEDLRALNLPQRFYQFSGEGG